MAVYNAHQSKRMEKVHGAELATFWRRAAAFVLDVLIMSALFAGASMLLAPLLVSKGWVQHSDRIVFALNANWYSIAWVVLYFGLAAYFGNGKTPGKYALGIRVVSLVHERLSLWHALERALGYGASMLEFGFGFVQYFIHPNKRTVHDRIAETIVVRDPRRKRARPRAGKPPPAERGEGK